jgi:hypothetical protein
MQVAVTAVALPAAGVGVRQRRAPSAATPMPAPQEHRLRVAITGQGRGRAAHLPVEMVCVSPPTDQKCGVDVIGAAGGHDLVKFLLLLVESSENLR